MFIFYNLFLINQYLWELYKWISINY